MVSQIYNERQRYIIPTSDWGFKRLFGSELNKGLLIGLLNKFIDDKNILVFVDDLIRCNFSFHV